MTVLSLPQYLYKIRFFILSIVSLIIIAAAATPRVEAWPSEWVAFVRNGSIVQDPNDDAQGSRNVVSDSTHAAAFYANDGTNLYFRIRLDDDPSGQGRQGAYQPYGWGFEIDANNSANDYEWLILLDGISKTESTTLQQNTVQGTLGDPSDRAEEVRKTYTPVTNYSRVVAADTSINGDQYYFLDFSIPYNDFISETSIVADGNRFTTLSDNSPIRFFGGSSSSANALTESGADLIGASTLYDGISDYFTPRGQAATTGTVKFVADINGSGDVTQISAGDTIYLAVTDNDQNTNLSATNTVTVTLTSQVGDDETVTLTETGANTGVFTASISSELGTANDGDSKLQVASGNTLTVTYTDAVDANGNNNQARTDTCTVATAGGATGTLVSTSSIVPGNTVTLTLTDADLNTNTGTVQTVQLTTTNTVTGETEQRTYTETGVNTGIFSATVNTTYDTSAGTNDDGTFNVQSGNTLSTTYNDALTATGGTATVTATTTVTGGATGTLVSTSSIVPGNTVTLTLTDADLNTNTGTAQTVQLTTTNTATNETEQRTYTETGADTGIFAATVNTTYGTSAGTNDNGTFNVQSGNTLSTTYNDALTATGGTATVTATTSVTGGATGTLVSTSSITPGSTVTLTLTDADLNTNAGTAQTIQLTTTNTVTGETEQRTYTETGVDTGIFSATVNTTYGATAGTNDDDAFNVKKDDTLSTTYNDALTSSGSTANVTATTNVLGGTTGTLNATSSITPGDTVTLTLTDADLNANSSSIETVQLTTTNTVTGETEQRTYTETGANTGVFVATANTTYIVSAGTNNDGTFNVKRNDTLTTQYNDALTNTGGTADITATTTVIQALITIAKSVDKTSATPSEILTYTITYENSGSGNARDVYFIDIIPANTTYVISSATGAGTTVTFQHLDGGTFDSSQTAPVKAIMWTLTNPLTLGASGTLTLQVKVD